MKIIWVHCWNTNPNHMGHIRTQRLELGLGLSRALAQRHHGSVARTVTQFGLEIVEPDRVKYSVRSEHEVAKCGLRVSWGCLRHCGARRRGLRNCRASRRWPCRPRNGPSAAENHAPRTRTASLGRSARRGCRRISPQLRRRASLGTSASRGCRRGCPRLPRTTSQSKSARRGCRRTASRACRRGSPQLRHVGWVVAARHVRWAVAALLSARPHFYHRPSAAPRHHVLAPTPLLLLLLPPSLGFSGDGWSATPSETQGGATRGGCATQTPFRVPFFARPILGQALAQDCRSCFCVSDPFCSSRDCGPRNRLPRILHRNSRPKLILLRLLLLTVLLLFVIRPVSVLRLRLRRRLRRSNLRNRRGEPQLLITPVK